MTGADAMTQFTPEAEHRLAEYLRQVRVAVARSPGVSPDEIEGDIREHIDNEFLDSPGPVSLARLETVLARLGPPTHWVPSVAGTAPALAGQVRSLGEWFRQTRQALWAVVWRGPEDWRLPYLAFGVFALGVIVFPLFPLFLLVSYVLARAGVAAAAERGVTLGARRWLVYPPMVVVAVPLLLVALFWVPFMAGALSSSELWEADRFRELVVTKPDGSLAFARPLKYDYEPYTYGIRKSPDGKWEMPAGRRHYYEWLHRVVDAMPGPRPAGVPLAIAFMAVGGVAAWWTVLGGLGWAYPGLPRAVFAPLAAGWEARHGRRTFALGLVAVVLWAGFAYRLAEAAGPDPNNPDRVAVEPAARTHR